MDSDLGRADKKGPSRDVSHIFLPLECQSVRDFITSSTIVPGLTPIARLCEKAVIRDCSDMGKTSRSLLLTFVSVLIPQPPE